MRVKEDEYQLSSDLDQFLILLRTTDQYIPLAGWP